MVKLLKCKNCGFTQTKEAWIQSTRDEKTNQPPDESVYSEEYFSVNHAVCPQCGKKRNIDNDLV